MESQVLNCGDIDVLFTLEESEENVINSALVEFSMRISKASYRTNDANPMRWTAIDSDVDWDLYGEKMSTELYHDFVRRIESKSEVPEEFRDYICEPDWCGGMPYLSIAHYKSGSGMRNVPGLVENVYVDGTRLKSKGTLHNNDLGLAVWESLRQDQYIKKSDPDHNPVRISIGFLDLEHKHVGVAGPEFTFTRSHAGEICPLCEQGVGGKIYMKGQLVHLALTRVPVNPRTEMVAEKSMDEITTRKDDAKSIIGDHADGLEEKSIPAGVLVIRSDGDAGSEPAPDPNMLQPCYDPNTDKYDQACVDQVMEKFMPDIRKELSVNSSLTKGGVEAVVSYLYKSIGLEKPVVEESMDVNKAVAGIPEKPFSHTQFGVTVNGNGNNQVANPVKAEAEEDDESKEKKEKVEEMSTLDKSLAELKNAILSKKSVEEVQAVFNALGNEVEKSLAPETTKSDDIATIIRSAVEQAVKPLQIELATLKAQVSQTPASSGVVASKALTINHFTDPSQMIAKSIQNNIPARQLSQIEALARKSTGLA